MVSPDLIDRVELPSDESLRLAELASYTVRLDQPEPDLMRASEMLAKLTGFPLAGVSLVDDQHIWLKGRYGVDAVCLDREGAFCAYAVESGCSLFAVPNTLADERFVHNPLVANAPEVRMYAAAMIRSPQGYVLGTVWVMDTQVCELSDTFIELLQATAAYVSQMLQLHRADPESGLPTRATFVSYLQALVDAAERGLPGLTGKPVSEGMVVGHIKLRNLALVRNAFGNHLCERVLKAFGRRLKEWVAPAEIVANLDSETIGFALLSEGGQLAERLESLEGLLARPIVVDGTWIHIACSVGVSAASCRGANVSALIDQAAIAGATGNSIETPSVRMYEPSTAQRTRLWTEFQRSFQKNIAGRQLIPCYQPQVDVISGRVVGFEALARYAHPQLGLIGPGDFLQLARHTGLLEAVDMCMLESVCADIAHWLLTGSRVVPVSINLSRSTLALPGTVEYIRHALSKHSVPAELLVIEILEDEGGPDVDTLRSNMDRLSNIGIQIALDDFGTGRSNLAALQSLKLHHLKVDRCFVHGASANVTSRGVLRLLASYADMSNLKLICEGVEDESDLRWAIGSGCRYFQGWYFSRAVRRDVATRILAALGEVETRPSPMTPKEISAALAACSAATTPPRAAEFSPATGLRH